MDARVELLERIQAETPIQGHFLGLLNILIGRRIEKADGTLVSSGITWRDLAMMLKKSPLGSGGGARTGPRPGRPAAARPRALLVRCHLPGLRRLRPGDEGRRRSGGIAHAVGLCGGAGAGAELKVA